MSQQGKRWCRGCPRELPLHLKWWEVLCEDCEEGQLREAWRVILSAESETAHRLLLSVLAERESLAERRGSVGSLEPMYEGVPF